MTTRRQLRTMCLFAGLALGYGAGVGAQDAVSPRPRGPAESPLSGEGPTSATQAETSLSHEALQPSGIHRDPEHIDKAPPAMIVERPGAALSKSAAS